MTRGHTTSTGEHQCLKGSAGRGPPPVVSGSAAHHSQPGRTVARSGSWLRLLPVWGTRAPAGDHGPALTDGHGRGPAERQAMTRARGRSTSGSSTRRPLAAAARLTRRWGAMTRPWPTSTAPSNSTPVIDPRKDQDPHLGERVLSGSVGMPEVCSLSSCGSLADRCRRWARPASRRCGGRSDVTRFAGGVRSGCGLWRVRGCRA